MLTQEQSARERPAASRRRELLRIALMSGALLVLSGAILYWWHDSARRAVATIARESSLQRDRLFEKGLRRTPWEDGAPREETACVHYSKAVDKLRKLPSYPLIWNGDLRPDLREMLTHPERVAPIEADLVAGLHCTMLKGTIAPLVERLKFKSDLATCRRLVRGLAAADQAQGRWLEAARGFSRSIAVALDVASLDPPRGFPEVVLETEETMHQLAALLAASGNDEAVRALLVSFLQRMPPPLEILRSRWDLIEADIHARLAGGPFAYGRSWRSFPERVRHLGSLDHLRLAGIRQVHPLFAEARPLLDEDVCRAHQQVESVAKGLAGDRWARIIVNAMLIDLAARLETQRALARVALAISTFQNRTGRRPERLAELVSADLAAIPICSLSGKPLLYDGARVWALGPDGRDDNGRPISTRPGVCGEIPTDGDLVWHLDPR